MFSRSSPKRVAKFPFFPHTRGEFFVGITIFDWVTIMHQAAYAEPGRVSEDVRYVFVSGQLQYENGKLTGAIAGRWLRRPGWHRGQAGSYRCCQNQGRLDVANDGGNSGAAAGAAENV